MKENHKGNKVSVLGLSCVPVGELNVEKCSVEAGKRVEDQRVLGHRYLKRKMEGIVQFAKAHQSGQFKIIFHTFYEEAKWWF